MSIPCDADGFLRRECPTCEREFKVLPTPDGEIPVPVQGGGYFCPYCSVQASSWWTTAQRELALSLTKSRVVDPIMKKFSDDIGRIGRDSRGIISAKVNYPSGPEPQPLAETEDMVRFDFNCHPSEPVKVLDGWTGTVHCIICGGAAAISSLDS
jgi:hypothetical protein